MTKEEYEKQCQFLQRRMSMPIIGRKGIDNMQLVDRITGEVVDAIRKDIRIAGKKYDCWIFYDWKENILDIMPVNDYDPCVTRERLNDKYQSWSEVKADALNQEISEEE